MKTYLTQQQLGMRWCISPKTLRQWFLLGWGPQVHRVGKPNNIWIDADGSAPEKLVTFANWAGREGAAVYVIPGTVAESGQAKSADVTAMQAIVVDIDTGDVGGKLAYLMRSPRSAMF